jgi:hypothetical protein
MMQQGFPPVRHHCFFDGVNATINLSLSDSTCETLSLEALLALAPEHHLMQLPLGYSSIKGAVNLREKIASLYQPGLSPENVRVFLWCPGSHVCHLQWSSACRR